MSASEQNLRGEKKKGRKTWLILLLLLLLLLIGILLYVLFHRHKEPSETFDTTLTPPETTAVVPEILEDTTTPIDTTPVTTPKTIKHTVKKQKDTIPTPLQDTAQTAEDTAAFDDVAEFYPCAEDTVPPWVYPDPSGGLHYNRIAVRFVASEPCIILWQIRGDKEWRTYTTGDSIVMTKSGTLLYQSGDTCGNLMAQRQEKYEIKPMKKRYCPPDMEYIKIGETQFCIDRYEWPNKKGKKTLSYISIYNAMDSCFVSGKRLCTSDEWSLACSGVYSWKYPYGDIYEPNACVTRDTAASPSGSRPECRGYFGVYDMSGNLAEWTDTRSTKNTSFYNVMGGFWESGPQASCFEPRYSYFPQNKHNPVGFRCCKDPE